MSDKLSLTYKNRILKVRLGRKELPLNVMMDPATITLSALDPPTLRFEMLIDMMTIDDLEAFAKVVTIEDLRNDD